MLPLLCLVVLFGLASTATAAEPAPDPTTPGSTGPHERFRIDLGLTFHHFQQQVKTGLDGERGERLIEETAAGLHAFGTYAVLDYLHVGMFTQFDAGTRRAGAFTGFDGDGRAVTAGKLGGPYLEWWIGPMVRGQYRAVFAELGWGALGIRSDGGRDDLPDDSGDTDGAFATIPKIAWLLTIGGNVPLGSRIDLVLRMEYRIRYYGSRGGNPIMDDVIHGTQDITPFAGVAVHF